MLSTYLHMQNAMMRQNMATANLMAGSDAMLNAAVSFGNSQPLRPVLAADTLELHNKAEETKIAASDSMAKACEKALASGIKRSVPKFGGVDYKA